MMTKTKSIFPKQTLIALFSSLAFAAAMPAYAASDAEHATPGATSADTAQRSGERADEHADAVKHLKEAQKVVKQMEADPKLKSLMQRAKGIYVVPDYGRAAAVVGGQGGAGVLLVRHGGKWVGPSFYNMGSVSVGLQAGASAGSIAMLLMNDKAVHSFAQNNNFSLDADAGISIVKYSARAQESVGKGDIVMWSDTEGAFAGASIAISDIHFDQDETAALYNRSVTARDIISGGLGTPAPARSLLQELPA